MDSNIQISLETWQLNLDNDIDSAQGILRGLNGRYSNTARTYAPLSKGS